MGNVNDFLKLAIVSVIYRFHQRQDMFQLLASMAHYLLASIMDLINYLDHI